MLIPLPIFYKISQASNTESNKINETSLNNQITNSIDKQINETSHSNQITNTKKLKRLEKKRQKRQSGKLDETIVANKARGDGVDGEGIKLDLNKIVDAVVRNENVDELCVVKQQIHSRNFRPYCNQLPLPRLRKVSTDLIKQIVLFQERLFKSDPLKGRTKRRYLVGVKEVLKSLPIRNKVKILFIAPDLECVPLPGGIDDDIQSLLTMATIQGVPYLFSLSRRLLGSLTHKPATSCLAVLDYSGTEEMVDEIFSLIAQARTMYDDRVLSLSNSLSSNKTTTSP
uniref:Selenocysteine insertion sequence-binding protein 2-like n=1 Tax=Cacopsylla melanoneura TaxID=428564 RepID=A0A8D8UDU7_9HEMI